MKKLSVLFALLAVAMMAKAQDLSLTAAALEIGAGETQTVIIKAASGQGSIVGANSAFQLDIDLPTGLKFATEKVQVESEWDEETGEAIAWEEVEKVLVPTCPAANSDGTHKVSISTNDDLTHMRVVCYSDANALFKKILNVLSFQVIATSDFSEGGQIKVTDILFAKAGGGEGGVSNGTKVTDFDINVTVKSAEITISYKTNGKYGTLILPFDAELPANYKAYTVSELDGKDLVLVEAESIVAFTPYVMEGDDTEVTFTGVVGTPSAEQSLTVGLLTGVVAEGGLTGFNGVDGKDCYICQKQGKSESSFYKIDPEKGYTIPQYRCYLTGPKTGALMYRIGGTTNIEEITVDENAEVYDVLGRKVIGPLQKGVYIKDGRKIYVK